jgi:hypothetical protein
MIGVSESSQQRCSFKGDGYILAHDWIYMTHQKWFDLSVQQFDVVNYCGMGLFKMFIFVFNLVPYLALRLAA